jgi:hypothetical protein
MSVAKTSLAGVLGGKFPAKIYAHPAPSFRPTTGRSENSKGSAVNVATVWGYIRVPTFERKS